MDENYFEVNGTTARILDLQTPRDKITVRYPSNAEALYSGFNASRPPLQPPLLSESLLQHKTQSLPFVASHSSSWIHTSQCLCKRHSLPFALNGASFMHCGNCPRGEPSPFTALPLSTSTLTKLSNPESPNTTLSLVVKLLASMLPSPLLQTQRNLSNFTAQQRVQSLSDPTEDPSLKKSSHTGETQHTS